MSCRQNDGNSAATSLAKFLTSSDEQLVSHIFHVARREAATRFGAASKEPADLVKVQEFLSQAHSLARHDSRIPDARRSSLLERIEGAENDLSQGKVPNRATFEAWVELRGRLEAVQATKAVSTVPSDPSVGLTPEGIAISLEEVNIARLDLTRLEASLSEKRPLDIPKSLMSQRSHESLTMVSFEVDIAREKYSRLQESYDATETGYALLVKEAEEARDSGDLETTTALERRLDKAEIRRTHSTSILMRTLTQANALGFEQAKTLFDEAKESMSQAENNYRLAPTPENKNLLDETSSVARAARRVYLYTLLDDSTVKNALNGTTEARSPQLWSSLKGNDKATQNEIWSAVDLYLCDRDAVEVGIGRLREGEIVKKSYARAEARQSLLDSEGKGAIDTINRRYNESIKRKRGVAGNRVAR